ncbi:MAG TPA: protein YhfH [Bacillota bacterium]|nr:protein YhfH [Bacillota bacterium]
MINVLDFFKRLPKKRCQNCHTIMAEKADCYGNLCDDCDHPAR